MPAAGEQEPLGQQQRLGGQRPDRRHHGWLSLWKLPVCFGCRGARRPSSEEEGGGGGEPAYGKLPRREVHGGGGSEELLEVAGRAGGVSVFQPLHYAAGRPATARPPAAAAPAGETAAVGSGGNGGSRGGQRIADVWWWGVVSGAIAAPHEMQPLYEALDAWVAGAG